MRNIVRNMRKVTPLDSLFTSVKQGILGSIYGQPDRWWYLSELASVAGKTPSSLQRELKKLAASGIVRTKREGARVYFQAETQSPLFEPLRMLIERTMGVIENLKQAIEPIAEQIVFAFVYGSVARGEERSRSDIDLIVIGDVGLAVLARVLRPLEMKFRREFDAKCYSVDEFRSKLDSGNHFLVSILQEPKLFIIGNENDVGRFVGKRLREEARNERKGDLRSS
jgi:predicted nucleotidyltransferase